MCLACIIQIVVVLMLAIVSGIIIDAFGNSRDLQKEVRHGLLCGGSRVLADCTLVLVLLTFVYLQQ